MNNNFWFTSGEEDLDVDSVLDQLKSDITIYKEKHKTINHLISLLKSKEKINDLIGIQEVNYIKRHNKNKWTEYLIYRYEFKYIASKNKETSYPIYVLLEPTSICNLRCKMCFQVDKSFVTREHMGKMSFELYKDIIDEISKNGTKAITFASRGEPLLHPKIGAMLEYASGKFIDIKINTNATKLTEKLSKIILSSGVNEIVFSVDSDNKEQYESIRVRSNWNKVLDNIKNFETIRREMFPDTPIHTRVSGVLVDNDQDVDRISRFWSQYVDSTAFSVVEERWDTYHNDIVNISKPCGYLWERMYVWHDGTCGVCDVDYKSKLSVGKFKPGTGSSIGKIWNSFKYRQLRVDHKLGNRSCYTPCDRCTHI
jgi:organic radical activating enzyme